MRPLKPNEVYFISTSARNKRLNDAERDVCWLAFRRTREGGGVPYGNEGSSRLAPGKH